MRRLVAAAAVAVVLAGCGPHQRSPAATAVRRAPASSVPDTVGSPHPVEDAPILDAEAADVAARYALAVSDASGPDGWVDDAAPLCTPQWLAQLRATGTPPIAARGAVVVAVYPSRPRAGGQRAVVVVVSDAGASGERTQVLEVELVQVEGHWLVGGD